VARILLVEDEESSVRALEHYFEGAGHEVASVTQAREAIERAGEFSPQILLTDLFLADREGGARVARELTDRDPELKVIVMTGLPAAEAERQLDGTPVFRICLKPLRLVELNATVEAALAEARAGDGADAG
jgi:DNA-binding NtrC family response regulator